MFINQMILPFVILITIHACSGWEYCSMVNEYCRCDDKCTLYEDCCQTQSFSQQLEDLFKLISCKRFGNFQKVWTFNDCPDRNHKFYKLCKKIDIPSQNRLKTLIPVFTSNGEVYENAFCALCNGRTEFKYTNVTVKCPRKRIRSFHEIKKLINNGDNCNVSPQKLPSFLACKPLVSKCPLNYTLDYFDDIKKNISISCEKQPKYDALEYTDGKLLYRNKHCCACWNKTCSRNRLLTHYHSEGFKNDFSYLLNFNEWDEKIIRGVNRVNLSSKSNETASSIWDEIIFYTSFTLTLLSIFALIVLIVIYSCHDVFHNFGGSLTICLSLCLLTLHLLNLITVFDTVTKSKYCTLIGILQHFIALSNFVWMAIYALELVQTFALKSAYEKKKKTWKTFLVYCIVAFGLTLLIVGSCTVFEFNGGLNSTMKARYGGRHCWFTSMFGGIIWYFGPVCILLLWNLVACITVFYKLSKSAENIRVISQKERHMIFWLCIRLTSIFGITYLFQIVAVIFDVNALIIVGSLLNCLQGTFIAGCFIWTKRVRTTVSSRLSSLTGLKSTYSAINVQKDIKDTI